MASRRIAFLDVDGTILDHGRTVQDSTVDAIRAARAAGHLVYLSTGRAAGDIHPEVAAIGFDGAISNGGARATSGETTVRDAHMPADAVEQLLAWFDAHGIPFILQSDDALYADSQSQVTLTQMFRAWMAAHTGDEPQTAPQRPQRFGDLSEADLSRVGKAVFVSDAPDTVARAQADLGDRFHVVPGSMPLPGGTNGEIGMRGVTKGSAITAILEHLGASADDAIGIGDSYNDLEMLQVCGVGIAMGNAEQAVKDVADEITTSVSDHGVANAFRRHGLI